MAKPRSPRRDTDLDDDYTPWSLCPDCASKDPQIRSRHQLDLARIGGLDLVRAHLTEQYVKLRDHGKERPDVVDSVCAWIANVMEQYSSMADEQTGAPLSWYEARQKMMRNIRPTMPGIEEEP